VTTMATTRKRTKDRLTPMEVKHAVDGWLNDGAGLHLRIKGRSKKWVFRYVRSGKAVEIGLGGADRVTLKTARELRDQHLATLAKGDDPRVARIKATAGRKTFAEVAADLIEARQKKWRTAANDGRNSSLDTWSKSLLVDCKRIAGRLVGDITTDDIRPIVQRYWNEGYEQTARRSLGRIEMVFDRAIALGWRTSDNPATWRRFQHILQAQAEDGPRRNHASLDWRSTPAFMERLRAESSIAAMALEMLILTACRSGEVRGMRWDEIDFDTAVWTIPGERMKRKLMHQVPLSSAALAILARLEATRTGALVFPGRSSGKPVDNVTVWQLVQRLTGRKEGEPITASPHGFRSTARSWMAHRRVDFDLAEACLAHKVGSAVSQRYNRESLLELRRPIMEDWAKFLAGDDSADVVPIRGA
jgi:integrase